MSVYALRDPRTARCRYVGRSMNPQGRLRQHVRAAHSADLGAWMDELAAAKLSPVLEILGEGTEAEWIDRLCPDLNINGGFAEGKLGNVTLRIGARLRKRAEQAAAVLGQSLNFWIAKAMEDKLDAADPKRSVR